MTSPARRSPRGGRLRTLFELERFEATDDGRFFLGPPATVVFLDESL